MIQERTIDSNFDTAWVECEYSIESSFDVLSLNQLDSTIKSNVSNIFISPSKPKKDKQRFVQIKQKVLNQGTDMSQTVDWSSFHTTQMGPFDSMATLSRDCDPIPTMIDESLIDTLGRPSAFDVVKSDEKKEEAEAESPTPPTNNMINLENVLQIEEKISAVHEGLGMNLGEVTTLCEDWWELTQVETTLSNLGNLFREPKYKLLLKMATLQECVTISIAYVISLHVETPPKSVLSLMKSAAYYSH